MFGCFFLFNCAIFIQFHSILYSIQFYLKFNFLFNSIPFSIRAAWYTSVYHRVTQVTSGYRVVVTFDVFVRDSQSDDVAHNSSKTSLFASISPPEEGIPPFPRLVWERIAAEDNVACARLAQCSRAMLGVVGGRAAAFVQLLRKRMSMLKEALNDAER